MDFINGHSLLALALPQCVSHCANWSGVRIFSSPLLNIAWNSEVEVALRQPCFRVSIFAFCSSVRFSLLNMSPQDAPFALLFDMPPQQPSPANTDAAPSVMTAATVNAKNLFICSPLLTCRVRLQTTTQRSNCKHDRASRPPSTRLFSGDFPESSHTTYSSGKCRR